MSEIDYELLEKRKVYGWENAMSVASDLWASIHSSLLAGDLVFAYKDIIGESGLSQIVIVSNQLTMDFSVGMITTGYTALLPHVPLDYLTGTVLGDLKKYKVDKNIIKTYEQIIENYKK